VHKRPGLVPLGYPMDEGGEARLDAERSEGRVIKYFSLSVATRQRSSWRT
jgi:hypothetical protein